MLASAPIVASDIPAFREVAGDAALFFPPDDPVALASAVDRVLTDSTATAERVSKGRERAASFSWKNSMDTLCSVFDDVLSESIDPGRPAVDPGADLPPTD
jgi:glycosyltransferase involved in cell wall biosynthesis